MKPGERNIANFRPGQSNPGKKDSSSRNCDSNGVCHKIMKHCGICGSCNLSASEELMFIDFLLQEAESSIWFASIESSQVSGRSLNQKN